MEVTTLSPYLAGIQTIPGLTQSEKLSTLNRIAKKIIKDTGNESGEFSIDETVPEVMKPLVRAEIARILGQTEEIIKALRSEDSVVVDRALRAKWFFKCDENSVKLFREEIWPFVTLQTRSKIIRTLASNLKDSTIAEKFYGELSWMYGEKQVHVLLIACSQNFIWQCFTEQNIILSSRLLRFLFNKYPELVINYFKFSIKNSDVRSIDINFMTDFLPKLIKKHPKDFVDIIELYGYHRIRLSNTRTELFLKNCMYTLMTNAKLFFNMLDLKTISKILTDDQFNVVFKQIFPEDVKQVRIHSLMAHLQFLQEEKRVPLMLSAFEEVYKQSLLNFPDIITSDFMRMLPNESRISVARMKLEQPKSAWDTSLNTEWVCYLPTEESIPIIMAEIPKTSEASKRCMCLKKLVYTCLVNSDSHQLLEMFKYISTRHKNEQASNLINVFNVLINDKNVKIMSSDHLELLYGILKLLYVKNELFPDNYKVRRLLKTALHLEYEISSKSEYMNFIADLVIKRFNYLLNTFEYTLVLQRKFLEELFAVLPSRVNDSLHLLLIRAILTAVCEFNDRNFKSKSPVEMIMIKNYPWIDDQVKKILEKFVDSEGIHVKHIKELLEHQKNLGTEPVKPVEKKDLDLCDPKTLKVLKNNPEEFSQKFEVYMKFIYSHNKSRSLHKFITCARWYQDLPIKIAEKCLEDLKNKNTVSLVVLSLLLEGTSLEKVITPFLPTTAYINAEIKEARDDFKLEKCIVRSFNLVNPPVSLDFIAEYCKGDHIHTIAHCLFNVTRRTCSDKVISFAQNLTNQPISIKKQGIRVFFLVTNVQQSHEFLINLWRTEKHKTIRTLVFKHALNIFQKTPCEETWGLFTECVEGLTAEDEDILKVVTNFEAIPSEFVSKYVQVLIKVFQRLRSEGMCVWGYIKKLLDIGRHLAVMYSEEFHHEIIENFVLDLTLPKGILTAGFHYLIHAYIVLAGEKLEERLVRFKEIFIKIVTENWNKPQVNDSSFYPANYFIDNMVYNVTMHFLPDPLKTKLINFLLDLFNEVVKPQQDPESCLRLLFSSLIQEEISPQELASKIAELLPRLIEIFSIAMISLIASCLFNLLISFNSCNKPGFHLDFVQSLIDMNTDETSIFAVQLLYLIDPRVEKKRFLEIVTALLQHPHPAVMSIAHVIVHNM